MKDIKMYLKESKTADFYQFIANSISDPKNITDADIENVIVAVKKEYGFELPKEEAESIIKDIAANFPQMF